MREDDLVGGSPDLRVVAHECRLVLEWQRFPRDHHLVHAPAVEVGTGRTLEVVHEAVHLLVRRGPVEVPALVGDVSIERSDRVVDETGHGSVVLDRFEESAASAAPVLERHRLRAEERDDLGVPRLAVRAGRLSSRLVWPRWAARTSSPRGPAACRTCARRSHPACPGGEPNPSVSSRPVRAATLPPAALPDAPAAPRAPWPACLLGAGPRSRRPTGRTTRSLPATLDSAVPCRCRSAASCGRAGSGSALP